MIRKSALCLGMLILAILCVVPASKCRAQERSAQKVPEPYVADFSYAPEARKSPGSAGVVFAVAAPDLVSDPRTPWPPAPQFAKLSDAFRENLSDILLAKGFVVRGPFSSYDLIPYSDKKAIDVYLISSIEIRTTTPEAAYRMEDIKIEVAGNVTLKLREITTGELLWTKSIPLESFKISGASGWEAIQWKGLADTRDVGNDQVKKPIAYIELGTQNYNDIAQGVEERYPALMSTIAGLIDPAEMRIIKRQAQELKRKKGY